MSKYIGYAILGGFLSLWGYIGAAIVGNEAGQTMALLLSLAYFGVISFLVFNEKPEKYAYVLVLPMIMVAGLHTIYAIVGSSFSFLTTDSVAFTNECKATEVKYIKLPTKPVRSIAYDWDSKAAPTFIGYEIVYKTRISVASYLSQPNVNDQRIKFTEIKPTSNFGAPLLGAGSKYLRVPKEESFYGVDEFTADVLVKYKTSPIEQSKKDGAIRYELTVSDRRNGDKLAYLRYVVDVKKQRACGLSGNGRVSDSLFIRKAIGL
jgi:hypothetical protein